MRWFLLGRTLILTAMAAAAGLLLVLFQTPAAAAPRVAIQDGEPALEQLTTAIDAAATWLATTHQNADGGYSSFSVGADQAPSDIGGTLDALWGLSMAGADTSAPIAYLETNADQLADFVAQDGSTAGKALLALAPTGRALDDFAGLDLVLAVTGHLSPTGQFGVNTAFNQSLAMMGLAVAGQDVPEEAAAWLADQQATEGDLAGSWDDGFGTAGNPDSTAMAMVALLVSGRPAYLPAIEAGLSFLEQAQLPTGGWEYGPDFGENANSTAMVILALSLLGEDLTSADSRWVQDGIDPVTALLSWQGESGAFQADFGDGRFDDFFSTAQSLAALGFRALGLGRGPIQAPVVNAPPEMTPTFTPAAAEPTATPEPATAAPEPTEVPPTVTAEATAVTAQGETAAPSSAGEDRGGSVLPWIAGGGAVVIVLGLAWLVIARRREA
jgi:hypothetical protein